MKILIGDKKPSFREKLRTQLESFEDVTEIKEISRIDSLFQLVRQNEHFDFLFLEKEMLEAPRQERISAVIDMFQSAKLILTSNIDDPHEIWRSFALGIHGYIYKKCKNALNKNALRLMLDGVPYVPPCVINSLPARYKAGDSKLLQPRKLTTRQVESLKYLSEGLSNRDISQKMKVSEATVKLHINALLHRLHAENRTKAVIIAQQMGLI